jgi:hypothetical protein
LSCGKGGARSGCAFPSDLETLRSDPDLRERQRVRFERMAPHVESTGTDGIYEVIDEVKP